MMAVDTRTRRTGTGCPHGKVIPFAGQAAVYRQSAIVRAIDEFHCVTMAPDFGGRSVAIADASWRYPRCRRVADTMRSPR